jgi:hypothetical protein
MPTSPVVPYAGESATISIGGTTVGSILSIDSAAHVKAKKVDTTILGATVETFRTSLQKEPGDLNVTALFDKKSYGTLQGYVTAGSGTPLAVVITVTDEAGTLAATFTWAKGVVLEAKAEGFKKDSNVEVALVLGFNDLCVVS